jgi:hypothetical protein
MKNKNYKRDEPQRSCRYNRAMLRRLRAVAIFFLLTTMSAGAEEGSALPSTPVPAVPEHRFWDRKNILLFSGIGAFRGLDYASTRNMQARGREEILLPDDVVNNSAGFASLEAAATAASVGISYIFHRTGHHKLERWLSIGHIGVTGFGVARNYALKSKH